jgi:hypothetical protein
MGGNDCSEDDGNGGSSSKWYQQMIAGMMLADLLITMTCQCKP